MLMNLITQRFLIARDIVCAVLGGAKAMHLIDLLAVCYQNLFTTASWYWTCYEHNKQSVDPGLKYALHVRGSNAICPGTIRVR